MRLLYYFNAAWMFTWSSQRNVRTLKQTIKSPVRPSTIRQNIIFNERFGKKRVRKAPSQHILIWCTVPYGLEIINAMFPIFQKIF